MNDSIEIRRLSRPEEFVEAVEVQARAWRMNDYREAAPAHVLRGLADNGGLVLGAFHEGRMIGVSYGWPNSSGGYFYSHATGVVEGAKYRGVGFLLKARQRSEVLAMGFIIAKWTFDPLQALNSRFNLVKLGAIARRYYVNYYGEITDPINRGLGSDRVKAEWFLSSARVEKALEHVIQGIGAPRVREPDCLMVEYVDGLPRLYIDCDGRLIGVEIPSSIARVREEHGLDAARAWREATRRAYLDLIEHRGYILAWSIKREESAVNLLVKASLEEVLASYPLPDV